MLVHADGADDQGTGGNATAVHAFGGIEQRVEAFVGADFAEVDGDAIVGFES